MNSAVKRSVPTGIRTRVGRLAAQICSAGHQDVHYPSGQRVSSSVTAKLAAVPDANQRSREHGRGYYKETLGSSLNNTRIDVKLSKDLSAPA